MCGGEVDIKYNSPLSECPLLISEIAQSVCLSRALTHVALAGGAAAEGSTTSTTGCVDKKPRATGYGLKFSGARMQPLTRGPEADETKTMTVAWPHHACVPLSKRRQHRPARSTCADVSSVRSSPLGADTVCKSGNSFADALFTQGLMAVMQSIICSVRP